MVRNPISTDQLAATITRASSKQTYYTIRLFVDRELVNDAFRAYGYFRWVDDKLDERQGSKSEKIAFIERQKDLLEAAYRGEILPDLCLHENMLVELVNNDTGQKPGLRSYLINMMDVMEFDATRCGREISQAELSDYTRALSVGVTDAMHYFIGHDHPLPPKEGRYLAVTAAHITHMLRDTLEDNALGYFNVTSEYLQKHGISPVEIENRVYKMWVCERASLARECFRRGRENIAQVKNLRCRLVGFAYIARFEWILRVIERNNNCLDSNNWSRKSLKAALWMSWTILKSILLSPWIRAGSNKLSGYPIQIEKP